MTNTLMNWPQSDQHTNTLTTKWPTCQQTDQHTTKLTTKWPTHQQSDYKVTDKLTNTLRNGLTHTHTHTRTYTHTHAHAHTHTQTQHIKEDEVHTDWLTFAPDDESRVSSDALAPDLSGRTHQPRVVDHQLGAWLASWVPLTRKHICHTQHTCVSYASLCS